MPTRSGFSSNRTSPAQPASRAVMGDRTVIMTAQPGRIKQIIDVPFPHPRDVLQLAASAEFGKLKLDIWRVLEEEVNRARAEMEK